MTPPRPRRSTRVKPFRPPAPKGDWPLPPMIDGEPLVPDETVSHPQHGIGRYLYADWVDLDGKWVDPTLRGAKTRRDSTRGQWVAIVTAPNGGGYRAPVAELVRP